jgi:hypothetical protein
MDGLYQISDGLQLFRDGLQVKKLFDPDQRTLLEDQDGLF